MVIKQVGLNLKPAQTKQWQEINNEEDKALAAIYTMGFLDTLHLGEVENIHLVERKFDLLSEPVYIPERELLFGDSLVNGEVSYMLRKYGVNYY